VQKEWETCEKHTKFQSEKFNSRYLGRYDCGSQSEYLCRCGPHLSSMGYGPVVGSCERRNEPSVSRKGVDQMSCCFIMARQPLGGLGLLIVRGFAITYFRHTTLGRTPMDELRARRRDLYLTTHNTHKRQTSMPPAGFEPTIPASERP
jgi:hypothetical protein